MRKIILLALVFVSSVTAFGQNYSNKGKDFWISYPEHVNGTQSIMGLYITSDVNTTGTISINGSNVPFTVTANTIVPRFLNSTGTGGSVIGLNTYVHLGGLQDGIKTNAAIHVVSQDPVVVYAHIIFSARSGSSLILPTNVWGKEYIVPSYANASAGNTGNQGYGEFNIMASLPNTVVEITPQITSRNGVRTAGVPYQITLANPGDVYQLQFPQGQDMSGTLIKSIASGSSTCQPIAVVSATTWTALNCSSVSGGDNLYQQLFPVGSWGKEFFTTPLKKTGAANDHNVDVIRVYVKDPTTVVQKTENGIVTTLGGLNIGNYYEYSSEYPTNILADKPIQVMEYVKTQGCNAPGSPATQSDPEMIALSSVEQTINDITVYSSIQANVPGGNSNVTTHYINVTMKTANIGTFKINGATPGASFTPIPGTVYSYLKQSIPTSAPVSRLTADSGFSAVAYGFGNVESYGYNAGTSVKDLNTRLEISNPNSVDPDPSACTNSPFRFKVYFPDSTNSLTAIRYDSIQWEVLNNASNFVPNNFPIMIRPLPGDTYVQPDSVNLRNGKYVAWYSLAGLYYVTAPGVYPIRITLYRSSSEGCGNSVEYPFDLTVTNPPTASFTSPAPGCYLEPVVATETTPQFPKATYKQWWEFYDPATIPPTTTIYSNMTSGPAIRTVSHTFTTPGTKQIRHVSITTPGCISDTIVQTVTLPDIPNATLTGNITTCINTSPVPVTFTGTGGTAEYIFSYNINGGATQTTPPSTGGAYTISAPTNVAGPFVYNLIGVANALPVGTPCTRAITGQSVTVNITPDATVTLRPGDNDNQAVCINNPIVNIRYDVGGSGTGGSVSGLPAGVTGTYAAGVITITGTPTVAGTFNYIVSTTGPCVTPQANGILTVNPDHTISLTGGTANQTVCINTPISPITLSLGGGATGITPAGLPPGVTATVAGNIVTISGTPTSTAGSPYNFTLTTTGNSCITANFTGSIVVNPDHAIALAGGNPNQTLCVNVAITPFTLTLSGGANNIAAPVNLPPGVTANVVGNTVTISGTPTLAGTYAYSLTTSGNSCLTANFTGTIIVNPDHAISLTGGTANQTVCINTPISPITLLLGGGATGITPAGLPPGVTATVVGNTVTISGAPTSTAGSPYNFTLTTTGNSCVTANFTGSITVNPDHGIALAGGNPNQTVCVNVAITPFTLTLSGGANNIAAPSNLPPGVTANVVGNTVTISGTPTVAGSYAYGITTTGNSCVTANFAGTINVTADATISLISGSNTQTVCRNVAITDIDYTIGGSATGANIVWNPSAPAGITFTPVGVNGYRISGTPTVVGTQTYNYTISTTGPCVKPTATGSITVNALPIATFTVPPPSCANNMVVFTNSSNPNAGPTTNWSWDFGDPFANAGNPNTSTAQSPSHYYTLPGTYTATLHIVNSNGCISTPDASVTFVVNDTPRAGFIVPDVCINDVATTFTDTSKISVGTINRPLNQWNYGDPASGPLNNSIGINGSHLYPAPGIYQVTQIVTSALGCKDTIVLPITINSADPVSNFTAGNKCSSDSVDLVNLSTVGFGNVTRLEIYWDNVGAPGVFQTINAPAFNGVYRHKYPTLQTTQTYNIRMIAYSGVICSAQKITPVTVYATPRVQFNNIPNTCYLVAPFQLTQGSEIGGVPGTGTYSGPGITNPNGTFNPQVAGIGTHNIKYTWTASNPGACIDTLTRTITVLDTAHATFSVTLPSCEQVPTLFTNLSTAPASVTLTNTVWNFGDATGPQTFAIASPISHLYAGPGTYTVTMHNVSAAGCLSTDTSMQITIDPNHHIALTSGNSTQTVCVNNSIAPISYTLSGGATNVSIPALPAGLSYTVVGTTVTITGAPSSAAGSPYNFTVQTTGNTCVVATANISITVDPDHTITFTSGDTAQSVCVNTPIDPIVYNLGGGATGVSIANLPPGVTYSIAGNILTISGTPTTSAGGPMFNFAIQTTGNSCVKANTIGEILVNDYPVPAFSFDKGSYCIPNANVGFINNTTPAPLSNHTYAWDFGDGGFSSAASPTHLYTSAGPFNVTLKARSTVLLNHGVIGCESNKSNALNIIHPQPKADFVFNKPSVCIGDNVTITDATDGKDGLVNQWFWDMGDGGKRTTNPVTYTYPDTIAYTITLYSINSFGCNSDTINKSFAVYPYPHVSAGPDKFVLEGGSVELEFSAYAKEPVYSWTPVEYLTDSKILRPRVNNPKTDMTYRLTVTGKGGCQLSDDVFVKLLKFPAIPNTFSPNGDGINDQWRIDYLNTYPDNRVQIFTRAGKLVFESRGYTTPWDGTIKGKPLPFDTYYYIIEPGNGRDPITGYVTILK